MKFPAILFIMLASNLTFAQQGVIVDKSGKDAIIELRRYITSESEVEDWYAGSWGRTTAFQVYAKYDPADARQVALAEMAKSKPGLEAFGLLLLDDAELPQLTEDFRQNLQSDSYLHHIQIIERYGTKDLLPDMNRFYQNHKFTPDCSVTASALGFIFKHDRIMGLNLVEQELADRKGSTCYKEVLFNALGKYPGEDLIAIALKYIRDSDPQVSTSAANLLLQQADSRAKADAILAAHRSEIPNDQLNRFKSFYSYLEQKELQGKQAVRLSVTQTETFELSITSGLDPNVNTVKERVTIGEPFLKVMAGVNGTVNVAYGVVMPPINGEYPTTFAILFYLKDHHGSGFSGPGWKLTPDKTVSEGACGGVCTFYSVTLSRINKDGRIKPIVLFQQVKP